MTNYYQTLGVSNTASADEIKQAYRRLASKHHPDRGGDTATFQEIQVAYDTLSNPETRAQYDNPQPQGFHFNTSGFSPNFEDMFAQFGAGGPFGNPFGDMFGQRRPPRNKSLNIQTSISLEEAFSGKQLMATISLPSGRDQLVDIKIPAGIQDGTTIRVTGLGDDSIQNQPRGDINLTVHIQPHPIFQRQNDDLIRELNITCIDAMLGTVAKVTTIDGKTLEINIAPGTPNGQLLATSGYGMPNMNGPSARGRMLLSVNITIPTNLTEEQKTALRNIFP